MFVVLGNGHQLCWVRFILRSVLVIEGCVVAGLSVCIVLLGHVCSQGGLHGGEGKKGSTGCSLGVVLRRVVVVGLD